MDIADDRHCFVCGPENHEGLQAAFTVDPANSASRCQLVIPSRYQGWQGMVHGGILATLLDESVIYACRAQGEKFVTAELTVRYKKPVPVETMLVVRACVKGKKRKLLTVRSWIEAEGNVCAEADAKVFCLD
ncbi:MAG TPA: PaaI family thioesterase [Desulfuromonadales bacterium]|nr:PaaI family thioesterase [Desulfuromonadales bacterium]